MFKKIMVGIAVTLIVVTAATAVATTASRIVFYTTASGALYGEKIVALYEKERPDVKVELIRGPSAWAEHVARLSLWIKTQYSGVDVLHVDDVFTTGGAYYGVWEDLTPYVTEEEKADLTDFQKQFIEISGGIYRIPWWNGMSYMYYRKDLFENEGVSPPKTWNELLEIGKRLTKDLDGDGRIDQWGYVTQGTSGEMKNNWVEFLNQAGGEEWELVREGIPIPQARKALEFMRKVYETIAPPALSTIGYEESRSLFREGKTAMLRDWASFGEKVVQEGSTEKIGVMNFPAGPAGPYGVGHCWGVVVNKYGSGFKENKDVVIDFATFMLRP